MYSSIYFHFVHVTFSTFFQIIIVYEYDVLMQSTTYAYLQHTEGHIKICFYSKNLVEACVGATGLDWVFPEPK